MLATHATYCDRVIAKNFTVLSQTQIYRVSGQLAVGQLAVRPTGGMPLVLGLVKSLPPLGRTASCLTASWPRTKFTYL